MRFNLEDRIRWDALRSLKAILYDFVGLGLTYLSFKCCFFVLSGSKTYEDENFEKKTKQLSAADVCVLKIFVAICYPL